MSRNDSQEKLRSLTRRSFLRSAGLAGAGLVAAACQTQPPGPAPVPTTTSALAQTPAVPTASPALQNGETVLGTGRGIHPGRVSWAYNPAAAKWDGRIGYWWEKQNTDAKVVADMLSQCLRAQTGQIADSAAWRALFNSFNARQGQNDRGYQPGQRIAIKINVNNCDKHAYAANGSFVNPALVVGLLRQLVLQARVPAEMITVYDAIRCIPDAIFHQCATSALVGVHFVDWTGGDTREQSQPDENVTVHWTQDVGGSVTHLPTCVTKADYLINLAGLKGHNLAGVTLTAKNHFGSLMADWKGQKSNLAPQGANIHATVAAHDFDAGEDWKWPQRPMGTYNALVDLIGHPHLGGKTLLFLLDGLYPAVHQSAEVTAASRWQSAPFNGNWTSSLFLSEDPVAIDSVGYDFLSSEPVILAQKDVLPVGHTAQNFLHEASQAEKPPSGTVYSGASLGVHEHWDNPQDKRYGRNLAQPEGIELLKIF